MTIKAWLEGDVFDLEALAELLPTGDVRVIKEDDRFYLAATMLDNPPQGKAYYEVAPDLMRYVNGLARANDSSYRPVRLTMSFQEGEHGHHVVQVDTLEIRSRIPPVDAVVTSADGSPTPTPPSPGPRQAALVASHPELAEALVIMGKPGPLNWIELWKVYEIVRDAVKPDSLEQHGWTTQAEHALSVVLRTDPTSAGLTPGTRVWAVTHRSTGRRSKKRGSSSAGC